MINPFRDVNWSPNTADKRKFALSLVIGFPCLAVAILLLGRLISGGWPVEKALWIGGVGCALGAVLWLLPMIARPFYLVWYALACTVGLIVSNTLLTGFYYIVMTGTGLVMRALGRKPLKPLNKQTPTYWDDAEQVSDVRRYYRQF